MARATFLQQYYLLIIAYMRWFGVVFAAVALLITACNLPWLIRSHDAKLITINLVGGIAFVAVGSAIYFVSAAIQRQYKVYIDQQFD